MCLELYTKMLKVYILPIYQSSVNNLYLNIIFFLLYAHRTHFVHDTDSVVLEDELQRIKLSGDCIDVNKVVTGVVAAVLGNTEDNRAFLLLILNNYLHSF